MKKARNLSIIIIVFSAVILSNASAQNIFPEVIFEFSKVNGSFFQEDEHGKQTVNCYVWNLEDKDVQTMINRFFIYDGIFEFTIDNEDEQGKRSAFLLLYEDAHFHYLRKMMVTFGIKEVIVDGKRMNAEEMQ